MSYIMVIRNQEERKNNFVLANRRQEQKKIIFFCVQMGVKHSHIFMYDIHIADIEREKERTRKRIDASARSG